MLVLSSGLDFYTVIKIYNNISTVKVVKIYWRAKKSERRERDRVKAYKNYIVLSSILKSIT